MKYVTVPVADLEVVMEAAENLANYGESLRGLGAPSKNHAIRAACRNLKQALESPEPTETGELLPCPFCGDEAYRYDSRDGVRLAHCANGCTASLPVEDWNTRHTPTPQGKEEVSGEARSIIEALLDWTDPFTQMPNDEFHVLVDRARDFLSQTQDRKEERPEGVPEFVSISTDIKRGRLCYAHRILYDEPHVIYRFDSIVNPREDEQP